jgi:translation initiation factor IF-3
VRCINPDGSQAGIMSLGNALRLAEEHGMDLVEITPNATPPVCRIMDYGKFKYEESQKKKQARKNQAKVVTKEVKFHANVGENDYQIKIRNIRSFLADGYKVKISLQFRGRENAHKELGQEVIDRVCKEVADVANIEQQPKLMGRNISGMLGPKSNK